MNFPHHWERFEDAMAIELWTPGDGPIRRATPLPCRPPVPLPPAGNGLRHLGSRGILGEFLIFSILLYL